MASPTVYAPAADADPASWTLPLLRYRPTPTEQEQIAKAENLLVERCAARFGIAWTPDPPLPPIGPKNLMDWRYGIHDPNLSSQRGYQTDAAQQARYDAAFRARATRPPETADTQVVLAGLGIPVDTLALASSEARAGTVAGQAVPEGGCVGEARRTLGSPTRGVSTFVQQLTSASYPESMNDPEVKAVFGQWSHCMASRGYGYAAPMDANDDPQFRPKPGGVSQREIDTAIADLDCRNAYRVAEVWHAAEVRIQEGLVAANTVALEADRRTLDGVIRVAGEVLAGR
ncbi:hypothetical protein [Kitasatospora herbaricolor]|uniref:Lipoprotein n=1 Tax=Kitasatospora herbaricolor TaxID=68217 RepID=A0ABZ1W6M6_9ACTN|nr:hypothetical protein [Kitasatospora herbaricolor]